MSRTTRIAVTAIAAIGLAFMGGVAAQEQPGQDQDDPQEPTVHPDRPASEPEPESVHPDRPQSEPEPESVHPDRPQSEPEPESVHPDRPQAESESVHPDRPKSLPANSRIAPMPNPRPSVHPDRPAQMPAELGPPRCPNGWKPVPPGVNPALRCLPDRYVAALGRPAVAKVKVEPCPRGWTELSVQENAIMRCQPPMTAFRPGGVPGQLECPQGWSVAPPDVALLRCLPNQIVANTGRPAAPVPPIGCPTGWKPVPKEVNRMMRCMPDQLAASPRGN
ncbi:hypothetical protein [Marilutibacter alkalisoli]|uniref:hypothetical protein n=1 Tax=Marilutibacter alkalisoli TaxID=2591633 RepID=UPI001423BAA8|nr:hypothetical protein [Lysobacter alkalisoli]